jgi:outer membrane protein OmpA-like peptidoglycan-associated protein
VLGPSTASAQDRLRRNLDLQLFLPPTGGGSTFTVARPEVPRHLTFVFGIDGSFARAPLERVNTNVDPETEVTVVPWLAQTELLASMGLFEVLEIGVALPIAFVSTPDDLLADEPQTSAHAGLGDMRLELKIPLVRGDFALSGRAVFSVPTGNDDQFLGVGYWTTTPSAVVAYDLGDIRLAGELGYRFRKRTVLGELEQDDEIHLAGGLAFALSPTFSLIGEAQLRVGTGGRTMDSDEQPAEADIGVRWAPAGGVTLDLGVGTGLHSGYGSPEPRAFFILRFATEREPCEFGPEDFDGYMDGDFCADPDNDGDGIPDEIDACPNDAEDVDGFLDDDGCPDTDNDADGIPDSADRCPLDSEDIDGHEDTDGCPDRDNDEDGIVDGLDQCPMEPEDRDEFQDEDGCPEPGPEQATVTVTDTRILISERIYFDFDTDTIRSVSMPLLDQVAAVINDIPAQKRVRVEGYTDDEGDDQYNLDLSYRRARAVVEYLAGRGVARRRLDFVGYGEANPVAPNDSPEGQALNRRVEFTIMDASDASNGNEGTSRRRRRGQD